MLNTIKDFWQLSMAADLPYKYIILVSVSMLRTVQATEIYLKSLRHPAFKSLPLFFLEIYFG